MRYKTYNGKAGANESLKGKQSQREETETSHVDRSRTWRIETGGENKGGKEKEKKENQKEDEEGRREAKRMEEFLHVCRLGRLGGDCLCQPDKWLS